MSAASAYIFSLAPDADTKLNSTKLLFTYLFFLRKKSVNVVIGTWLYEHLKCCVKKGNHEQREDFVKGIKLGESKCQFENSMDFV